MESKKICIINQKILKSISPKPNEYRWFWDSSEDPWNKELKNHLWAQYDLHICDQIEQSFQAKKLTHESNDLNYIIHFDYIELQKHVQIDKKESWKKRPVIRKLPSEIKNSIRIDRADMTEVEPYQIYENYFVDQIQIFCYSQIFSYFEIDQSDSFIRRFTCYCILLDKKIISVLKTDYVRYLQEYHHVKILNDDKTPLENQRILSFSKLKDILSKDLKYEKTKKTLSSYVSNYVNHLTQENFNAKIVKMYTEEGQLYKNLNKVMRGGFEKMSQNMEYIFFYLCFLYVQGYLETKIDEDITVFRGTGIPNKQYEKFKTSYAVNNVIINYEFMSTSKRRDVAEQIYMSKSKQPKKVFFEIQIEKPSCTNPHLSFQPCDVASMSQFPSEEEILIPPNGVFQVRNFLEEGNVCRIQMEYRTNLFNDSLPFILKNSQIAHQFGLYTADPLISQEEFQQIVSLTGWTSEMNFQLLSGMGNLRQLVLSQKKIGDEGIVALASHMIHLTQLQHLKLNENKIKDKGMKALAGQFINLSQLHVLDLSANEITDGGMKEFTSNVKFVSQLQDLNLYLNEIGDEGIEAFAAKLNHLTKLQQINFSNNNISEAGMKALADNLHYLTKLQQLILGENIIGDAGMVAFASQLCYLTKLKQLDLHYNEIGNAGMQKFSVQLKYLEQLEKLDLSDNKIGKSGLKNFASQLIHLTHIQKLNLDMGGNDNSIFLKIFQKLKTQNPLLVIKCSGVFSRKKVSVALTKKELFTQQFTLKSGHFLGDSVKITQKEFWCIQTFEYYQNVKGMDLSGNKIGYKGMQALAPQLIYLTQLQQLNLSANQIGNEGIKLFAPQLSYLTQLQQLNLSENEIGNEGMQALTPKLKHLTQLQQLNLSHNEIGDTEMEAFAELLSHLTQLQQFNLSHNEIGYQGIQKVAEQLSHLTQIQYLNLSHNEIGDMGLQALASQLIYLTQLQELKLKKNKIGNEGIQLFVPQLSDLTQLQQLNLSDNEIRNEGMQALAPQLKHLTQLQELNLGCNTIRVKGIKAFATNMRYLTQLQKLDLRANFIKDEGLKAFASQIIHLIQLQKLNLSHNEIGDQGMSAFASQMIHLIQLRELNLSHNKIGDEGMKAFASKMNHLIQLQELILCENKIGKEEIEALASNLNHFENLYYDI